MKECKHSFTLVDSWGIAEYFCIKCNLSKTQINKSLKMEKLIKKDFKSRFTSLGKIKTVGPNLINNKVLKGKVNWILFDDKANITRQTFASICYGTIPARFPEKTKWMWDYPWRDIMNQDYLSNEKQNLRGCGEFVNWKQFEEFVNWMLNDGPWSHYHIRKSFKEVYEKGFLINGSSAPLGFVVQGQMLLRSAMSDTKLVKKWFDLKTKMHPTSAIICSYHWWHGQNMWGWIKSAAYG